MLEINSQTKILKIKGKNSFTKMVILVVDVTILLVKMQFFKKFHKKVDAGRHKFIYFRFFNGAFIILKQQEVCLHPLIEIRYSFVFIFLMLQIRLLKLRVGKSSHCQGISTWCEPTDGACISLTKTTPSMGLPHVLTLDSSAFTNSQC